MSIFQDLAGNKQMKKDCTRAWEYLQKHQVFLVGEYRKSPVFVDYYRIFPPVDTIGRLVDDALHRYYHPTSRDTILAAANLFEDLINIHPFEDGNGRLCRIIQGRTRTFT